MKVSTALALYFTAQIATVPFVWGTYKIVGLGALYSSVYMACSVVVLSAVALVAVTALNTRRYRLRAAVVAGVLTMALMRIVFAALDRHLEPWGWTLLIEAGVLTWSAAILGGTSAYLRYHRAALILSLYWLARVMLDLGFLLHWPKWNGIGVWAPTAMAAIAMTLLWRVPWYDASTVRGGR